MELATAIAALAASLLALAWVLSNMRDAILADFRAEVRRLDRERERRPSR